MVAWGASVDIIEKASTKNEYELWHSNIPALEAFFKVQTQLTETGLHYPGVESGLRMAGIKMSKKLFADLQAIEFAVMQKLHEERERTKQWAK